MVVSTPRIAVCCPANEAATITATVMFRAPAVRTSLRLRHNTDRRGRSGCAGRLFGHGSMHIPCRAPHVRRVTADVYVCRRRPDLRSQSRGDGRTFSSPTSGHVSHPPHEAKDAYRVGHVLGNKRYRILAKRSPQLLGYFSGYGCFRAFVKSSRFSRRLESRPAAYTRLSCGCRSARWNAYGRARGLSTNLALTLGGRSEDDASPPGSNGRPVLWLDRCKVLVRRDPLCPACRHLLDTGLSRAYRPRS